MLPMFRNSAPFDPESANAKIMKYASPLKVCLALISALVLSSCDEGAPVASGGTSPQALEKRYFTARKALEAGQYEKANRNYLRLIEDAAQLAPRLRLELSHSYLRGGNFAAAAEEARRLSASQTGTARSAALAVLGTAEHELALVALAAGDRTKARGHLKTADKALAEVVKKDPGLDPLGALAGRRASIAIQIKSLG